MRGKRGIEGQGWARNKYRLINPDNSPDRVPNSAPNAAKFDEPLNPRLSEATDDAVDNIRDEAIGEQAPNEIEALRGELGATRERLMGLETRFRMLEHAGQ